MTETARLDVASLPDPILIVAPHPDDEVLAAGGLIQQSVEHQKSTYVLFLTNGDANADSVRRFLHSKPIPASFRRLGRIRRRESIVGDASLGLSKDKLIFLGFPDNGLLPIVQDRDPNRIHVSPWTQFAKAEYFFSFRRNAPYSRKALLDVVTTALHEIGPKTIVFPSKFDFHSDHRASHAILVKAVRRLAQKPILYTYLVHYGRHYPEPSGPLRPPGALSDRPYLTLPMTRTQTNAVRHAFTLMPSQSSLGRYYYRWIRENEWFWPYPRRGE